MKKGNSRVVRSLEAVGKAHNDPLGKDGDYCEAFDLGPTTDDTGMVVRRRRRCGAETDHRQNWLMDHDEIQLLS
jgi:hypothetical protein